MLTRSTCTRNSLEAPVDDLDDPVLLLRRHLVIARQAQASVEDIRSHIDATAHNVRITSRAPVTLRCDKCMR